jgi:DNA replicative helicase MCM subunit Mcm2 (Cdc46/Mcm family)
VREHCFSLLSTRLPNKLALTLQTQVRLAQAHARLCFRQTVTVADAIVAVAVTECSMQVCLAL